MVFMTPRFTQVLSLTNSPLVSDRPSTGSTGHAQGDSSHKERNRKGRRDKVCSDVMTQKVGPCPALGGRSRSDVGHRVMSERQHPTPVLLQGMAAPELKLDWGRSKSAPHYQVMNIVHFVLSLLKEHAQH